MFDNAVSHFTSKKNISFLDTMKTVKNAESLCIVKNVKCVHLKQQKIKHILVNVKDVFQLLEEP